MGRNKVKSRAWYTSRMRELDRKERLLDLKKQVRDREIRLGLRKERKKPSWSKIMMAVVYSVCMEIVVYAEIAMWVRYDLSALYALIGVPAAMFGVFWAYAAKSRAENTKGGIVYDAAMAACETVGPDPEPLDSEDCEDTGEGIG